MGRFFKRFFFIVLLLIVIVVGGAISLFYLAPSSWIANAAADSVREQTGRELTIEGEVERNLFPLFSVRVTGVRLSNADWAGDEPMIEAEAAAISVRTMPLLGGSVEVEEILLENPTIRVAIDESGRSNFDFPGDGGAPRERGAGRRDGDADFILVEGVLKNGRVLIDDRSSGEQFEIGDINIVANRPTPDAALAVTGGASILAAATGDAPRPIRFETRMGGGEGEGPGFVRLETAGLTIAFDPQPAGGGAALAGELTLDYDGTADATQWIRSLAPPEFADVGRVSVGGPVTVADDAMSAALTGVAVYKNEETALELSAECRAEGAGGACDLALSASNNLLLASFDGAVAGSEAGAPSVTGAVVFRTERLRDLADWAGAGPIDAPEGTFRALSLTVDLTQDGDATALENLVVALDDANVAGSVRVEPAQGADAPPRITASLVSDAPIDLRPFLPETPATAEPAPESDAAAPRGAAGWSDEPFNFGYLDLVNADIRIETAGLTLPRLRFTDAVFTATIEDSRLELAVERMALYSGSATGRITLDADGAVPALAVVVDIGAVQLRPFMNDTSDIDWLEGAGALNINVAGEGGSMRALMASLDGTASILFTDGAIIGYNLAAIVRNITSLGFGEEQERKTDFAEISASFVLQDGVAANDDLTMSGPLLRMTGSGTIDIGNRSVNYRAEPKAVATLEGQGGAADMSGLVFPLLVTGPWEDVSVEPDLLGDPLGSVESFLASPDDFGGALSDAIMESPEFLEGGVGGLLEGGAEGALPGGLGDALPGGLGGGSDGGGSDGGGSSGGGLPGGLGDSLPGGLGDALGGSGGGSGVEADGGAATPEAAVEDAPDADAAPVEPASDESPAEDESGGLGGALEDALGGEQNGGGGLQLPGGLLGGD